MIQKLGGMVAGALAALAALLAVLLVGVRLIGFTPYTVKSGSMVPLYPVGSLIYVQKTAPETITEGEAITFVMDAQGQVATHQVWRVDAENRLFYTQGIANIAQDGTTIHDGAPVPFESLLGKPVFCIPFLGLLALWLTSAAGRCVVAALLLAVLLLGLLPGTAKPKAAGQPVARPAATGPEPPLGDKPE